MLKNKIFIFSTACLVFLFLSGGFVLALENNYPSFPGAPNLSDSSNAGELARYVFEFGIGVAGVLAVISFVIGAVGLIAAGVSGSPESRGDAIDRIKGSILGLILTLASFIILNTINTSLTNLYVPGIGPGTGVVYTNGSDTKQCPSAVEDTSARPSGYNSIKYTCSDNSMPRLIVIKFPQVNFSDDAKYSGTSVEKLKCGQETGISGAGSFQTVFETPGVYFYMQSGCQGLISSAGTGDKDDIAPPFKGNFKSVGIVPDQASGSYYGVIFHQTAGLNNGGICTQPIINSGNNADFCNSVNISAAAADIFKLNKDSVSSGTGVSFYSAPFEDANAARAGFYNVTQQQINPTLQKKAEEMCFDYTGINRPDEYKFKCSGSKCKKKSGNSSYDDILKYNYAAASVKNVLQNTFLLAQAGNVISGTAKCIDDLDCPKDETCDLKSGNCVSSSGGGGNECFGNEDCNTGEICDDFICKPASGGTAKCASDSDCPLGQVCDDSGACVKGCIDDIDCPSGQVCNSGACASSSGSGSNKKCSNTACETFLDCPGSIKVKGNYLVALYSQSGGTCKSNSDCPNGQTCNSGKCASGGGSSSSNNNDSTYCQTFKRDVPNLNSQPFVASGNQLKGVYIIATK